MNKFINYLKETRTEMLDVKWPTKAQTISFSIIVIIVSAVTAMFLGGVDFSLNTALTNFLK